MYWFGTNPANSDIVVAKSPIVQAAATQRHELGEFRRFPAALNKFPDPTEKFPVTRFKIPFTASREFLCKTLDLVCFCSNDHTKNGSKRKNSLYFPCLTGNFDQRRVRSRLRHPPTSPGRWGFSAQLAEIGRGCGFIQMFNGTGERHLPVVCGQPAADFSVGECGGSIRAWRHKALDSEQRGRSKCAQVIEPARTIRRPQLVLARSTGEGDRSVPPRPRQSALTAAYRLRSSRRSLAPGTPTASIV
jgi:hypothetical protein